MTENTTASGAADLPEFPGHPEPQIMMWTALEIVAIRKYGADMFRAGRLAASAPVAPAPQPAPMPYPTDAQIDAVYEQTMGQHLRSQDAPAVRRFGRAMFLCAWNAAAPKAAPGDALDEAMRERDDAEDFINELLDEVLGADRPEWSSAYNRYDAMNDVRERITALHKPAADKAWGRFGSATAEPKPSPAAQGDALDAARYRAGIPGNFITHRAAWREALETAKFFSTGVDRSYWGHELAAFDRSFDRLWTLMQDAARKQGASHD